MFTFTPVETGDFGRLKQWLMAPHVRAWWGDPQQASLEIRTLMGADWAEAMIVAWQGRSIGYLQAYDAAAQEAAPPAWRRRPAMPAGTFGVGFFIGEAGYVGQGLGPSFLGLYTDRLLTAGRARRIVCHPAARNRRAIRCLEKAGFTALDLSTGDVVAMEKRRPTG
jgi:aminoglycoside 6'-N-acetyltransferase